MLFSELIFEAIVVDVSYEEGTCSLSPLNINKSSTIEDVKLPYLAGGNNAGLFIGINVGTRVIGAYTSGRGQESAIIISFAPKENQFPANFDSNLSLDVPIGTTSYPDLVAGRMVLRGNRGSQISLFENGDVCVFTAGGAGTYLRRNGISSSYTVVSEDISNFSNSGRVISGSVNRINNIVRNVFPAEELSEVPLYADTFYSNLSNSLGFFRGSIPLKETYNNRKRNPEIAEYRHVINEFTTDSEFTGFDDEVGRINRNIDLFEDTGQPSRTREIGNSLYMAEHELIEVIGGNLVDIKGNILDINYRNLSYGGPGDTVPDTQLNLSLDRARRISRRGVGYHFQLSTKSRRSDESRYENNFVFDVDKEGVLKINVPASSNTGNIPFPSFINYNDIDDSISVAPSNPSRPERIPVLLRDSDGEIVTPTNVGISKRETGLRYSNDVKNPYFPSDSTSGASGSVRINSTKYHNMYAAGERLFANQIVKINIPSEFVSPAGITEGNPAGARSFEIPIPENYLNAEEIGEGFPDLSSFSSASELVDSILSSSSGEDGFPTFMSVVGVLPSQPAIYPGGNTVVSGLLYDDDDSSPPLSNLFESSVEGEDVRANIVDEEGDPAIPSGGKSANLSFLGSLELSIGADNFDRKSIVLDTEGSFVSWFGKDRNDRSMIMQTDGGVFMNIGGTYEDQNSERPIMNKGRFDLRVNVTDKGFVDTQFDANSFDEETGNPLGQSDYIISISEEGIVIAGMKSGKPMILRNDGKILIESTEDLVLKGNQVKTVEAKGKSKTTKSEGR